MNFSDFQWEFPDEYVQATGALVLQKKDHRFIVVRIANILQFRSGLVPRHADLAGDVSKDQVVGGGFIFPRGLKGHRVTVAGKSGDYNAIPILVQRFIGEQLQRLLLPSGITIVAVQPDTSQDTLNPFWEAVDMNA